MTLRFLFWNVQHGSAAYIRTPNGKHLAIDLGTGFFADGTLFSPLEFLLAQGVNQLDYVTITHPHLDHIDDILSFDKLSPKMLVRPKHLTPEDLVVGHPALNDDALAKLVKYAEIDRSYQNPVEAHENIRLPANNGGVTIKQFSPYQCSRSNLNNHSIVTTFEYCGVKVLIPGDNESASWNELLELPEFREAIAGVHVFVASHHGRESGFHAQLFDYFAPLVTVVSDGPVKGTSVTEKYTERSQGWNVDKRSGWRESRKCITTRNDGFIDVKVTPNPAGTGFLSIAID